MAMLSRNQTKKISNKKTNANNNVNLIVSYFKMASVGQFNPKCMMFSYLCALTRGSSCSQLDSHTIIWEKYNFKTVIYYLFQTTFKPLQVNFYAVLK